MYKFEKAYEFINLEYSFKQEVYYEKHRWAQLDKNNNYIAFAYLRWV